MTGSLTGYMCVTVIGLVTTVKYSMRHRIRKGTMDAYHVGALVPDRGATLATQHILLSCSICTSWSYTYTTVHTYVCMYVHMYVCTRSHPTHKGTPVMGSILEEVRVRPAD